MQGSEATIKRPPPDIWYGLCGYWTDDWSKLADQPVPGSRPGHGIPCCPVCGAVGFQKPSADWWRQVDEYEAQGHPGYRAEIEAAKDYCPNRQQRLM